MTALVQACNATIALFSQLLSDAEAFLITCSVGH